jgi:hypothetical protein
MLDVMRIFNFYQVFEIWLKEENMKFFKIILFLLAYFLTMTSFIQMIENYFLDGGIIYPKHDFFNVLYFVIYTVSTIGYSSSIVTTAGRICAFSVLIVISLLVVPQNASQIVKLFSLRSEYSKNKYKKIS